VKRDQLPPSYGGPILKIKRLRNQGYFARPRRYAHNSGPGGSTDAPEVTLSCSRFIFNTTPSQTVEAHSLLAAGVPVILLGPWTRDCQP
jgi:hypothetical protein